MSTQTLSTRSLTDQKMTRPRLPSTLALLQNLRADKNFNEKILVGKLDTSFKECKAQNVELAFFRMLLHMGDISRWHNILRESGIKSPNGGAQERKLFRALVRWWQINSPKTLYANIDVIREFTSYETLMYWQTTTDRRKGNVLSQEELVIEPKVVYQYLTEKIRAGKDLNLIAKHLPKWSTSKNRVTKMTIKAKAGKSSFEITLPKGKSWYKVNGNPVDSLKVKVNVGDVISWCRGKQKVTLSKDASIRTWIEGFCDTIGWTLDQYRDFRKKQATPEQSFSSKTIAGMSKSDFEELLNRLTAGQRFRVAKMVAQKDKAGNLTPRDKWKNLGTWYIAWEKGQEKVASMTKEEREDAGVKLMVKSTGMQTIDLLVELFKGQLNDTQINNTYQSMIEKMDLIANVFPVIDGSGSMDSYIDYKGARISYRQIVYAMAIAFSTRNPVEDFRNTFGWFSNDFKICGKSKFINNAPNKFVQSSSYTKEVKSYDVLSEKNPFMTNFNNLRKADPGQVASTNMFSVVEYFVDLVKNNGFNAEDLPNALLFLTDGEYNTGKTPREAQALANSIGWSPLFVFWMIQGKDDYKLKEFSAVTNCLFVGGFSEGVLSQILRGIKSGSIDPEDELWSIYEDARYSLLKI